MKILITGGTGFLGRQLLDALIEKNHELVITSRQPHLEFAPFPAQVLPWPIDLSSDTLKSLDGVEAIIHLAGENIAGARWSPERKNQILSSRITGTQGAVEVIRQLTSVHTFISSSAIGFYGNNSKDELTENSPAGVGFLSEVCQAWEAEALKARVRTVLLRTGIVLGRSGGVLEKLEPLFRNNVGGPVGSGEQFMSWIHEKDWINAVLFCLENKNISGPVNLTAPQPVSNKGFSIEMGELFHQPFLIPAPAFALKVALGEMSTIALDGQFVLPEKLLKTGFRFQFQDLKTALYNLYDINPETADKAQTPDDLYTTSQWIPRPIEEVFQFFCDEKNLERITPPLLNFNVVGKSTAEIGKGTLINYNLKIHGLPVRWQTLIQDWDPPRLFSDTQLQGPYKKWYHVHHFCPAAGGTLMRDRVRYRLPLGYLGRTGGLWLVRQDVEKIFSYRRKVIREMYS